VICAAGWTRDQSWTSLAARLAPGSNADARPCDSARRSGRDRASCGLSVADLQPPALHLIPTRTVNISILVPATAKARAIRLLDAYCQLSHCKRIPSRQSVSLFRNCDSTRPKTEDTILCICTQYVPRTSIWHAPCNSSPVTGEQGWRPLAIKVFVPRGQKNSLDSAPRL